MLETYWREELSNYKLDWLLIRWQTVSSATIIKHTSKVDCQSGFEKKWVVSDSKTSLSTTITKSDVKYKIYDQWYRFKIFDLRQYWNYTCMNENGDKAVFWRKIFELKNRIVFLAFCINVAQLFGLTHILYLSRFQYILLYCIEVLSHVFFSF